jgi:hexokinase
MLPRTKYDDIIDRKSPNPGEQTFEKLISGMYLGEVVRLVMLDLIMTGELFGGQSSEELKTEYKFETANMSRIERYVGLVFFKRN